MASKNYEYFFTESAETDIDLALSYLSDTLNNPDAASDLVDELEEQLDIICKRPETGKIVENEFLKRNDVWRFLVKNYIAYYLIDDKNQMIIILRFVYSGRDQDKIVKDF